MLRPGRLASRTRQRRTDHPVLALRRPTMVHSPPSRPCEQEAIDHLVENRSVAVDIDGVIPCLLKHKAENEGVHHPGDRVRIETCDKMPLLLAFTYEVSDLLTLADSVAH